MSLGAAFQPAQCLVDLGETLATYALLSCFAIAHSACRSADDGDTHAVQHRLQLAGGRVNAAARRAHALDVLDDVFAVGTVFQFKAQLLRRLAVFGDFGPIPNVTFAF